MKIIKQSWKFEFDPLDIPQLKTIEEAGRTCWKSTAKENDTSEAFISRIMNKNHQSILEHSLITVRIITDRGVTHELVRHRLASFSQSSTRYCNFSKDKFGGEITFILPVRFYEKQDTEHYYWWVKTCMESERSYMNMIKVGNTPQEARDALNNSLQTEIVMSANIREWLHVFNLRTSKAAHPQIRELMIDMKKGFAEKFPTIFGE